ncbi:glycosyltransferase family 2 protein [Lapillicoccus jejuensis]|uniref:Glycosyl transferase family 2 n=1 Tax=Lapillicoccus jejuensis TaxID=402171 RepID=A0A542E2V6_9MICO|nr:glycosyltransferase family 2 protein [Lapillicoccus jejuensis]TQJ09574.1 glycosyl transferase family 2 [Lapillicoccus jejuensis]
MTTLTVVMPVHDEAAGVLTAVGRVLAVNYPCPTQVVVVDDASQDATWERLETVDDPRVRLVRHERPRGRGAAVRTGVGQASGSHVLVLGADLAYSPDDVPALLAPVLDGVADHVFGVRVLGLHTRFPSFRAAVGGRATTLAANLLYGSCLTDLHAGLKVVPTAHVRALGLERTGAALGTELTARLLRAGVRPYEVAVSYRGRPPVEGRGPTVREGLRRLAVLVRVRLAPARPLPPTGASAGPVARPTGGVPADAGPEHRRVG